MTTTSTPVVGTDKFWNGFFIVVATLIVVALLVGFVNLAWSNQAEERERRENQSEIIDAMIREQDAP